VSEHRRAVVMKWSAAGSRRLDDASSFASPSQKDDGELDDRNSVLRHQPTNVINPTWL